MGVISIQISGSFHTGSRKGNNIPRDGAKTFGAAAHGHAHAVQEAIAYLTNVVLPLAINLDHELHDDGEKPKAGFEKKRTHAVHT